MSDRVQTVIAWLTWAAKIIGVILTLIGGGQAVQIASSPEAYGSADNIGTSGTLTVAGILTTFLAPLIAKGVSAFWSWKRGRKATPVLDYGFALGCVANLREYLVGVPAATGPLDTLKELVAKVESDRIDPPAPTPDPAPASVVAVGVK